MKIDRLVSILMMLLEHKRIGAQELADRFEVSLRTIYRDMEAINRAGIPIRAIPGTGGGFEVMPAYKLDQTVFSASDLAALLMGLSSLSSMIRGEEVLHALAKVKHFIPAERAQEIAVKANQVRIDLRPWMGNSTLQPHLERIKAALGACKLLTFVYIAQHGKQTARTVEPYQLVLKGSHWYLQGYCRMRNAFRLFRVSRMSQLEMQEETFTPRDAPAPELDFDDLWAAMQIKIKLRIHASIVDRVLDHCTYEDVVPEDETHYIVDFPFIENDYHYDRLLSFGPQCECIAPPSIRAEMKRRIQAMAAIYER